MMPEHDNPWFRLGHAFERTLQTLSSPGATVSTLRKRKEAAGGGAAAAAGADPGPAGTTGGPRKGGRSPWSLGTAANGNPRHYSGAAERVKEAFAHLPIDDDDLSRLVDALFAAGAGTLASRLIQRWGNGQTPPVTSLFLAGMAGAGAALITQAMRPLLEEDDEGVVLDRELAYVLLEGVGRGLIYGILLQRRIPGPPLVKGAVYGTAEYLVGPWGGMSRQLHSLTPQSSLPVIGALLEPGDTSGDTLAEHLLFGTSLALLYGIAGD